MKNDNLIFNGKFEFNKDVASCFDDMISRSIPEHETMRYLIDRIARRFVRKGNILDIGCSSGLSVDKLINDYKENNFILIDSSKAMIDLCTEKFRNNKNALISTCDLLESNLNIITNVDVVLSIFVLQFIPTEYRQNVLNNIYRTMNDGACILLAEKNIQEYSSNTELFREEYYNLKQKQGYSLEQIETKRKALQNSMFPDTMSGTIKMMNNQGFKNVEVVWKCLQFTLYIGIK